MFDEEPPVAIHIADPETVELVERCAKMLRLDKTATIRKLMRQELERLGQPTTVEKPKPRGRLAELDARCRSDTHEYDRLKREKTGKGGTRVWGMLKRHGSVETYTRMVLKGPGEALRFLAEQDRLAISAEQTVLEYQELFSPEVRKRADEALAWAREIQRRKKK